MFYLYFRNICTFYEYVTPVIIYNKEKNYDMSYQALRTYASNVKILLS